MAEDKDSGSGGIISYAIQSGNKDNTFSINQTTGEIKLSKPLDFEVTTGYNLSIVAMDLPSKGDEARKVQTSLTVTVTDVNDNAPVFNLQDCNKFVSDDTSFGAELFDIKASDADTQMNGKISYEIVIEEKESDLLQLFSLDKDSGVFSVKGDLSLDKGFPNGKELKFRYIARDSGDPPLFSEIQCSIHITGENKHAPILDHSDVITVVTSSIFKGHRVTTIRASDKDSGPDGTLSFAISSGSEPSMFAISDSGVITLAEQASQGYYLLNVQVSDQASVIKRKSISCLVHVYFSALPINNIGNIILGEVTENKRVVSVTKGEQLVVPISIQLGLYNLEGFDIEVIVRASVEVTTTSIKYKSFRQNATSIRFLGLADPNKNIFGIHQIGDVTIISPQFSGDVAIDVIVISMVSQEMKEIESGNSLDLFSASCVAEPWNIVTDCKLDMRDASFVQAYVREQSNGFISSFGKTLQSISPAVKNAMDTDQNGILDNQDVQFLLDSLVGKALTVQQLKVVTPGKIDENKQKCDLLVEVKTKFNSLDTAIENDYEIYLVFSHDTEKVFKQTKSSSFVVASSITTLFEGDMKYLQAIKMNTTPTEGVYRFTSQASTIFLVNLGTSLIIKNKKTGYFVSTFNKGGPDNTVWTFDTMNIKIPSQSKPQTQQKVEQTSSRCQNPLQSTRMRMKLVGDFDQHILGKEKEFEAQFKGFFESHILQKHSHTVYVTNMAISKGSVVVQFDMQHEAGEKDQIVSSLVDDLENEKISMQFDGLDYPAQPTLRVGDEEQVKEPVVEVEDAMSKAYIAIGVIIGLILIFAFLATLYLCKKRGDPYAEKEKQEFELKSSTEKVKYPSMTEHPKKAGVVNNAYEYFKTLDHSGTHTPNTRHVVESLRKKPNLEEIVPSALSHPTHLDETRATLRRRITPKNLEEMQRELRVSFVFCWQYLVHHFIFTDVEN